MLKTNPDFLRVVDCPRSVVPVEVEAKHRRSGRVVGADGHQGNQGGGVTVHLQPVEKVVLSNCALAHQVAVIVNISF